MSLSNTTFFLKSILSALIQPLQFFYCCCCLQDYFFISFYLQPVCIFEPSVYPTDNIQVILFFKVHSDSPCLSAGLFNPFTLSVVSDMAGITSVILFFVFYLSQVHFVSLSLLIVFFSISCFLGNILISLQIFKLYLFELFCQWLFQGLQLYIQNYQNLLQIYTDFVQ